MVPQFRVVAPQSNQCQNNSTCRRYHTVAAANLQGVLAQCKYEIIFYDYLIYANIVNMNILHCENLALYGMGVLHPGVL